MEPEMLARLERIELRLTDIQANVAGNAEWRISVDRRLMDHNTAIEKLRAWQFKLIGAYLGAAILLGLAFQVLLSVLDGNLSL